jgi:hypothetical protein
MIKENECYNFMLYQFDVYKFYEWAKENLKTISVGLDNIAKGYSFNPKEGYISMFRLDKEYARELSDEDIAQPLLFVSLGENCGSLMIDGTHRSFNLWEKGEKEAPAYLIEDMDILFKFSNITKKMLTLMNE